MGLYDFDGGSLGTIGESSPVLNPAGTSSGGWMDTGLEFLNGIADKWLQYSAIQSRVDLEQYPQMQRRTLAHQAGSGIPTWLILGGAIVAGVVVYRAVVK